MNHSDLVALLEDAITERGGRWADLGAGEGNFTLALADLLGPGGHITAVDRDAGALKRLAEQMGKRFPDVRVKTESVDFTHQLDLSGLDGIVMANSLHFVRDKAPVLESVRKLLGPGGKLVVVEYGSDRGNPWVPHPFSYERWETMAAQAGFERTRLLRTIPSRHLGSLYSVVATAKRLATASGSPPDEHAVHGFDATSDRSAPFGRRSNVRHPPG